MGKGPKWSDEEKQHLLNGIKEGKDEFRISEEFHVMSNMNVEGFHKRSPDAILRRIKDLPEDEQPVDESKPRMHWKSWSEEDDDLLKHYKSMGMTYEQMAEEFDRTESAVESRWQILKSKKSSWEKIGENFEGVVSRLRTLFGSSGPGGK
jgi:transposase-like protein